ncbi:hypothetical protein LCI18_014940 [Fusarium solani-melongenae]|uniref:Uncharacterized protein n=1 Tax=Fusarium solani subsp. cucurbitae TaxID=2747967 RepID=A0ACD3ZSE9_FUSSC|nr:hypothetical protein LCI18_014940 [Fusarium solani-melongenae]
MVIAIVATSKLLYRRSLTRHFEASLSGSFCLARKFSASRFTAQLVEGGATRMLYGGELCRYLIAASPSPYDQAPRCMAALGNGLHRDVGIKFQKRFRIPEIHEVYRSSEGVAKFDNFIHRKAGAAMVGFAGPVKLYSERKMSP